MAKRKKIGLIYKYDENWIGGTYYIQNLISALNLLPDKIKPELKIITDDAKVFAMLKHSTGYKYLSKIGYKKTNFFINGANRLAKKLINRKFFTEYHNDLDVVFPVANELYFKPGQKFLYWIADFQEHYYPDLFSDEELLARKQNQLNLVRKVSNIVFSSYCAKKDFDTFYPDNKNKKFVLPFAVSFHLNKDHKTVLEKYNINQDYFICSNQFWKHKNHSIVLKAISSLKEDNIFVVFTGKEYDYRHPGYYESLIADVNNLNIQHHVLFLGFIDRQDQLSLMKSSKAVIQPSLFEGWSTVIEDAKALNVGIIASDIDAHQEQLSAYELKQFFSPMDSYELANCIRECENHKNFHYNYQKKVFDFGKGFYEIVNEIA